MKNTLAKYLNLLLVFIFPLAWFAPLLSTSLLPAWEIPAWLGGRLFEADTISVVSGLQKLWATDIFLAMAVTFFALVAPMLKCLGMALIQFQLLSPETQPVITVMGKLAMADIFILSLFVVIAKGIGVGKIEIEWGLYLFTMAVVASFAVSLLTKVPNYMKVSA